MKFFIWDIETLQNCFLFTGKFAGEEKIYIFEISDRKNERDQLLGFLSYLKNTDTYMVGYNSIGFDYPITHVLLIEPYTFDAKKAHLLAMEIIGRQEYGFTSISYRDRIIQQIDLAKINHFDNKVKRTSLKSLQFAMRSESVEDLPFPVDRKLTFEEMDSLIKYNVHDVTETEKFFNKCKHAIDIRFELLKDRIIDGDVLNYSDVKIGTEYLIKKIGRSKCFIKGGKPRQSLRHEIKFQDIILPKIEYRTDEFQKVHEWFKAQTIYTTNSERPHLEVHLAGLDFHFGVGGLHASVENKVFESTDTHVIKDIDVSGMYVAVAIANGFHPEHLGQEFVTAYKQLQRDRSQYPKGSTMNLVLKLAGNGVYGNSNNPFSCFYDPKYTFSVTVNGQLQLLQLVELLAHIPNIRLIQANTDGITALVPRQAEQFFNLWKSEWECLTGLKLEEVEYSRMFIRDVNNYLAVTTDGKIKRKGAYAYPIKDSDYWGGSGSEWHKDFSNLSAQKAVEQVMLNKWNPEDVVRCITNPFDFMLRYKTTGGAKVYLGEKIMPKTVRYYVSKSGQQLKKIAKPKGVIGEYKRKPGIKDAEYLKIKATVPAGTWDERIHTKNKSKYIETVTTIESGRLVKECNHVKDFNWADIDYEYYVNETKKLIIGESHV